VLVNMTAIKRITDLSDYTSVLPYASEPFGVYQPLLGWRSKRRVRRINVGVNAERRGRLLALGRHFEGRVEVTFNEAGYVTDGRMEPGVPRGPLVREASGSLLLAAVAERLRERGEEPRGEAWLDIVNEQELTDLLNRQVFGAYLDEYRQHRGDEPPSGQPRLQAATGGQPQPQAATADPAVRRALHDATVGGLGQESALAGLLLRLADEHRYDELRSLFYAPSIDSQALDLALADDSFDDPYLTFDPTKAVTDVTLSPIGVVHLFRQYFFELDTFLGTPVGHVWLSPGSTVELVEVSTRKTIVERTTQTALETVAKAERSATDQDEISEAVKQENRNDTKLGFSTTVKQSWGTGNAVATGSLNLDTSQQTAREQAHKRIRQQSEKLSTEIRQNFTSTFRTVTETIDTSSKRYVLNNGTGALINYELRRKMRQVGVQIQDVGTYLCWETFVDDPGRQLSLADLIHIAKPADLVLVPNPKLTPMPPRRITIGFSGEAVWSFPSDSRQRDSDHPETGQRFVPIATLDIPGVPPDYEVAYDPGDPYFPIEKTVVSAEDDDSWDAANWAFLGMITPDGKRVMVGVVTGPGGLAWDDRITFKVSGAATCRLLPARESEITKANNALIAEKLAADAENNRKLEQAYRDAVRDRVTLASKIEKRRFEDLREEERTIVYRNLVRSLMTDRLYHQLPETPAGHQARHVLSELINSIFDIDKMLYFVAPEWWKPRAVAAALSVGGAAVPDSINGSVVRWADDQTRPRYFITDASQPAPLGSSLGWLLQLDGDDLRNAFLNAPWVKAVIPIRPGKEQAAIAWLQNVGVEGADGLDAAYEAPDEELAGIRARLLAHDPDDPVAGHDDVTIGDAIRYLCLQVADKHRISSTVGRYPDEEINDDNRVSATPVEKVFEHGFYPLKGGFKAKTERPFEICSQWLEILPTDQVVPVEVKYDPKTGRQV
jgi:hypothetical protein